MATTTTWTSAPLTARKQSHYSDKKNAEGGKRKGQGEEMGQEEGDGKGNRKPGIESRVGEGRMVQQGRRETESKPTGLPAWPSSLSFFQPQGLPERGVCKWEGCTRTVVHVPGKQSEFCSTEHALLWLRMDAAAKTGMSGERECQEGARVPKRGAGGAVEPRAGEGNRAQKKGRNEGGGRGLHRLLPCQKRGLPPLSPTAGQNKRAVETSDGTQAEQGSEKKTRALDGQPRDKRGRRIWPLDGFPVVTRPGSRASRRTGLTPQPGDSHSTSPEEDSEPEGNKAAKKEPPVAGGIKPLSPRSEAVCERPVEDVRGAEEDVVEDSCDDGKEGGKDEEEEERLPRYPNFVSERVARYPKPKVPHEQFRENMKRSEQFRQMRKENEKVFDAGREYERNVQKKARLDAGCACINADV